MANWTLVPNQILDAGPMFTLSEAVSISDETDDQAVTDRIVSAKPIAAMMTQAKIEIADIEAVVRA